MEKEFDILSAKLNIIKDSMAEIENFARKQSELFEVLSRKFPNIEQFTNALKEAHELQERMNHLEAEAAICARTVGILSAKLNSEKNTLKEKQETVHMLIETLSKIDGMDETTLNNLKKLMSGFK
ncbi:MAG: hypothetical protein LBP54_02715 [Campylobacteraceae bacterium]|jgi:uncharacterized coiled-coil protein SlyX|nr:hypothetical protein [Campylobacteraceae bacterium]